MPLIAVDRLMVGFGSPRGSMIPVVREVSLSVAAGEALGIAGESGSGKSTLLLAMMGIVKPGLVHAGGHVTFDEQQMLGMSDRALESIRGGRLALIPQNAGSALTPSLKIGQQIDEVLSLHTPLSAAERSARIVQLLGRVRLPDPASLVRRYPHQFSGGQVQRVAIAMALAGDPVALLLDEPTTGLDVTTQLGILELLDDLRRDAGVALICVSHDLGVLARLCDRIAVMYAGAVVEEGPAEAVLRQPQHPYTSALLGSIPRLAAANLPQSIPGRPPAPQDMPPGCAFAPRCAAVRAACGASVPPLAETIGGRRVACFFPGSAGSVPQADAPLHAIEAAESVLNLNELSVSYRKSGATTWFPWQRTPKPTVNRITLELGKGEVLGLVGESGSGKSTILKAISGLWPKSGGAIGLVPGRNDAAAGTSSLEARRIVQLVFQNPDASLNPRHTIREILAQPLRLYFRMSSDDIGRRAAELLRDVRLDDGYLDRYPGQLSGGERQRVAIARAFAAKPDILLCDEVTSALDVSVQASVMKLIRDLGAERGVATILVSHDLAVVQALSHRIAVLYRGELVEIGPAREVCRQPKHPYTRALLAAALEPVPGSTTAMARARDTDDVASAGCPFAGRCLDRVGHCLSTMPAWDGDGHCARCHLLLAQAKIA